MQNQKEFEEQVHIVYRVKHYVINNNHTAKRYVFRFMR